LKAIRLFCMAVVLVEMFPAAYLRAQEPAGPLESYREATVPANEPDVARTDVALAKVSPAQLAQKQIPQNQDPQNQDPPRSADGKPSLPDAPTPEVNPSTPSDPNDQSGKQPKRILGIIPNYRAVSANEHLPPLKFKGELWLATQDTFDYSDFIFVGALAGFDMAGRSQPAFGQGAEGYGKYYWHVFVDGAIENYMRSDRPCGDQGRSEILHLRQRRIR